VGSDETVRKGRLRAAWTLVLLTTACAELTFTAVAVPSAWLLLPLLMVMYGAGVLVVREAVVRTGAGWPGLLLLGLAYQLAEDGLGLQALTSPQMYGAADWGLRAVGINWTYWESQIGVHVVLSVLVPVTLTELIFPAHSGRPYLRPGGFVIAGFLALIGVAGLRTFISATEDPGYTASWGWTAAFTAAIGILAFLALRVVPRIRGSGRIRAERRSPRPVVVGIVAAYLTMAFLTTLLPIGLGGEHLFGDMMSQPLRLIAAAMTAVPFGFLVLHWRSAGNWTDTNRIWLIGGILVSHTAFMMPASIVSMIIGLIVIIVQVTLLVVLDRRIKRLRGVGGNVDRHDHTAAAHPDGA
jgi:hypothetical protein